MHQLRAMADHAAPLDVLAGFETGGVDERDDRQVERVAPLHEPCGLAGCVDVERARSRGWLIGDDADGPTGEVREPDDDAPSVIRPELEERIRVDDVSHHRT